VADRTFEGRTVLVTGGGTGIGRAAALGFAALGADRVLVAGRRPDRLAEVAGLHPSVVPVPADVTTEAGAQAAAAAVREHGGVLDVLVHNAGIFRFSPLDAMDAAVARAVLETNVLGPVLLTAQLLPLLRAPGGAIVVVSSRAGHNPAPGAAVYAASKAAAHSLTRTWAAELAPRGIRVNAVAPGFVRTEAYAANGLPPEAVEGLFQSVTQEIPLGRVAEPEIIASWITRLADPTEDLLTGQIVTVDGGMDVA